MTTKLTDEQKKMTRRLRRMGLRAPTARRWMDHVDDTDNGRMCLSRPHLRDAELAPVIEVLKSCVVKGGAK